MTTNNDAAGGAFLLTEARRAFTAEHLAAEDRAVGRVASDFLSRQVLPMVDRIEAGDHALMYRLMQEAGQLGLLSVDVPSVYGGLGLRVSTAAYVAEKLNWQQSFALTHEAHTVIATLPLLYFGNHEQKMRYLPKLATGEWIGSFGLSEANAGSDALAAETNAVLSGDGLHYILNGMKMWITNTGFAQLFTIFAQVVGAEGKKQFTGFLVERDFPGVSFGNEERKLGMRGTSTRRINLDNVRVPVENALEVGKGQYAAFCALNMGRFKLEAGAVGGLKETLAVCARYATERRAFKRYLGEFGMVRHKLAEMAARTFALESMIYRLAGDLDGVFEGIVADAPDASARFHGAAEEFAIECNIVKVIGSETYSRMTDEAIQIHGGYGYTEDFAVARAWRDQRLLRIGEGANEIVRLAIVNLILRRDAQGRLPVMEKARRIRKAIDAVRLPRVGAGPAGDVRVLCLYLVAVAVDKLDAGIAEAQEPVAAIADVICSYYALDSVRLRIAALGRSRSPYLPAAELAALVSMRDYSEEAVVGAKLALDTLMPAWRDSAVGVRQLVERIDRPAVDIVSARRQLAGCVLAAGGYPLA